MALNKADLKNNIIGILTDMMQREESSIEEFATRLSDDIDTYVKTATIKYTSGLVAPNGAVTGTFNGKLE
ncbi:MAG: hypothetical protein ACOH2D_11585 [Gelidibacter sp.]